MAGNTFRLNDTVVVDVELTGLDTTISDVNVQIDDIAGYTVVSNSTMTDIGNQRYRYFWDTSSGYSGSSSWSAWSAYPGVSGGPVIYSGWSGTSGYSWAISGIYVATVTASDANNHYGSESFKIRIG